MTDRIGLRGITAHGRHGVLPHEHDHAQPFVVDVDLELDLRRAGHSDDLSHTVSYAEVAADVVDVVAGPHVDLVETLAERIADACLARPFVDGAQVWVHKPHAPVGVPVADVVVHVRRELWRPVVVALGSNRGDTIDTLTSAVRHVSGIDGVRVRALSRLYDTDPVGGPDQPSYLNAVMLADTRLSPHTLMRRLAEVESSHGRRRTVRWGARTLDLDIVQMGDPTADRDVRCDDDVVELPHPRAHERTFVLVPWLQVDPDASLRVGDDVRAVGDLVAELDPTGRLPGIRLGPTWSPTW